MSWTHAHFLSFSFQDHSVRKIYVTILLSGQFCMSKEIVFSMTMSKLWVQDMEMRDDIADQISSLQHVV